MQDTELYARLLSLGPGWRVSKVDLDMDRDRIDVWVETTGSGTWLCPECGTSRVDLRPYGRARMAASGYVPVPDVRACAVAENGL